jgi:hypothetical protein
MVQVSESSYIFLLPRSSSINHITVFVTHPFPDGYAATVHYNTPPSPEFNQLGFLSNDKPSAVFKLKHDTGTPSGDEMLDESSSEDSIQLVCAVGFN